MSRDLELRAKLKELSSGAEQGELSEARSDCVGVSAAVLAKMSGAVFAREKRRGSEEKNARFSDSKTPVYLTRFL